MTRLTLYTTLGCHLCEQLEALLAALSREALDLQKVEIADDEALVERYGIRIPVLVDGEGGELDRGFEVARLAAWLQRRGWLDEAAWARLQRDLKGEEREVKDAEMRNGRRYLR